MKRRIFMLIAGLVIGFIAGALVPGEIEDHRQAGFTGR